MLIMLLWFSVAAVYQKVKTMQPLHFMWFAKTLISPAFLSWIKLSRLLTHNWHICPQILVNFEASEAEIWRYKLRGLCENEFSLISQSFFELETWKTLRQILSKNSKQEQSYDPLLLEPFLNHPVIIILSTSLSQKEKFLNFERELPC